jgi:integrase
MLLAAHLDRYFACNPRIRDDQTRKVYRLALARLAEVCGHAPTVDDLTDDNVASVMTAMLRDGRAIPTVNERRARLNAFWTWLAKRGVVGTFPTTPPLPAPRRIPRAWTREELGRLVKACAAQRGWIACVPASDWWLTLHYVAWDSGERIGALLGAQWSHLSGEWLILPAEIRKGQGADRAYRLSPQTVAALEKIRYPVRGELWPWPFHPCYLWSRYKKLRKEAGLPIDRQSGFHRIRRSVASHLAALGGNATEAMGHSSPAVTRDSYIDPTIAVPPQPSDLLFRLEEE